MRRNHIHATIRGRLVTLRAFATWLRKAGHIAADPFDELEIDRDRPSAFRGLWNGSMCQQS